MVARLQWLKAPENELAHNINTMFVKVMIIGPALHLVFGRIVAVTARLSKRPPTMLVGIVEN